MSKRPAIEIGKFLTPEIESERIKMRPLSMADAEHAYTHWASDPDVARYMNWNKHESINDTLEWLIMEEENIKTPNNYTWGFVLKETGQLIGSGGINYNEEYGRYELGYNLMKKYWNQGLTTEAAARILKFSAEELGITEFMARHAKENPASGQVMLKAGFKYVRDGSYSSLDGQRIFQSKEYELILPEKQNLEDRYVFRF